MTFGSTRRVHLRLDARRAAGAGVRRLAPDPFEDGAVHVLRRRHEARVARLAREARQGVEEVRRVLAELRAARHEAEIRVDARRRFVVVAGAEVHVAPDLVLLAADDERDLAVRLEADDAVDHVDARLLERLRPLDVLLFVEARLQLHEDRDLLAVLGRADERGEDGRVRVRAVQGHLDRDGLRVDGGALDHLGDRRERVVGVVEKDVAGADRGEDRRVGLVEDGGHGRARRAGPSAPSGRAG